MVPGNGIVPLGYARSLAGTGRGVTRRTPRSAQEAQGAPSRGPGARDQGGEAQRPGRAGAGWVRTTTNRGRSGELFLRSLQGPWPEKLYRRAPVPGIEVGLGPALSTGPDQVDLGTGDGVWRAAGDGRGHVGNVPPDEPEGKREPGAGRERTTRRWG